MYGYGPRFGGWGWALGLGSLVFWAVVVIAIIALVVYFTRGSRRPLPPFRGYAGPPGPAGGPPPAAPPRALTPEQILAERFARGEIGDEEFRQRLATLREQAPPGPGAQPS